MLFIVAYLTRKNIPQKFLCSGSDSLQIGKVKFEEDTILSGDLPQLFNGSVRLSRVSCGHIHPSIMRKQGLQAYSINAWFWVSIHEKKDTLAISKPTPVFAPVTMMTLPDRSGISLTVNLDFGGKRL